MHLRPRLDRYPIWRRVTDHAGLKLDLWFHNFTVLNELPDAEYSKSLRDGDEECVVSDVAARADAAAKAKGDVTWVRFWFVGWGFEEAFRAEGHRVGVDSRIVGEPPKFLLVTGCLRKFYEHDTYQALATIMEPLGIL
jgi:hypothetical protein